MHADLGELDEAAPLARRAVELFEEHLARLTRDVLRVTATDDVLVTRLYTTALQVHLARGGDDSVAASFRLSDRCRGIALADLLASDQAAGADPAVVAAVREWHRRGAELARTFEEVASYTGPPDAGAARQRIAQAERALDDAEAVVQRVAPQILAGRRLPPPSPTLAELQPLVPPDTVLVQYHAADDELVAWAVSRDEAKATRTRVETARLAGLAARFHRACSSPGSGPGERLKFGSELSELVLGPLQAHGDGFERLVVVPHGNLNLVPFHLLPWEGGVLGDRVGVSHLPAAVLLPRWAGSRTRPRLGQSAVVVGDPGYGPGRGLPPLRGARTEAVAVARLLGVNPLIGAEAVGTAVEAAIPSARILHLATHGLLKENAPSSTELALAGEDALTIPDLLGLDTDIDLAVLSACHSGRGRATTSGDVVGLTRALFAAGARDLVVSLWPVDDVAGCLVMVGFYEQLRAGQDITEALARSVARVRGMDPAARETAYSDLCGDAAPPNLARDWQAAVTVSEPSEDPDHPYWWGPFVHIGL
jgi:CHAT domain-containing protein